MNLDQLAATVTERVAALPDVTRIYPPKRSLLTAALARTSTSCPVVAQRDGEVLTISVNVAMHSRTTATEVTDAIGAAIHNVLDAAAVSARRVTIRIASIDD